MLYLLARNRQLTHSTYILVTHFLLKVMDQKFISYISTTENSILFQLECCIDYLLAYKILFSVN